MVMATQTFVTDMQAINPTNVQQVQQVSAILLLL